jgi:hypothetical protein
MKTLHVKIVTRQQVVREWGLTPPPNSLFCDNPLGAQQCYIRCNIKGVVNWEKAPIYSLKELIERNDVKIVE